MKGVVVACLVAGCALGPRPPPAPPRHTSLGIGISTSTLPNGLRVVLVQDPHAPEVEVTMRYHVGAIDDGAHPGIAHLAEHLMFQQVLGSESLFAQLEHIATYFNALTTHDATTYVSRAPKARLDRLLSIEGVRMGLRCTSIDDSVFQREREVVINELRQSDDADQLLSAIHAAAYPEGHPYRKNVIGTIDSLGAITRDDVCRFVDAHYAPANAVLVVSGNLTPAEVETSLKKFIARVARRDTAQPASVPAVTADRPHGEALAPIDDDALLVTWTLPTDPLVRARVLAIAPALVSLIDGRIEGRVAISELGDEQAPLLALIAVPSTSEPFANVREAVEKSINELPLAFTETDIATLDELVFNRTQQTAIYQLYAGLENDSSRDITLANYVLMGRDPNQALGAAFQGVRELSRESAIEAARQYLGHDSASFITLKADIKHKRGHDVAVRAAVHDMGQRRTIPDIAAAHQPATLEPPHVDNLLERQLPNGMHVVLLSTTSVPTVDVRMVFAAGTADEPATKIGVSVLAAKGLGWNFRYFNDLLAFAEAGGTDDVHVGRDRTTFEARGLDMHLDYLLAGLRRRVIDGTYEGGTESLVSAMREQAKESTDRDSLLYDTWQAALYGDGHPYVRSGVRFTSTMLTDADAAQFRAARYTPDNATLVLTGHFDIAMANRWIDYLFSGWHGHAEPRTSPPGHLAASSIALVEDIAQANVRIAFPVTAQGRAERLVAAQMLDDTADDVRHQLGATYGVTAFLQEDRLATHYELAGWVDASRAGATLQFIAEQLASLRKDNDVAARAFVLARDRVLARLDSVAGTADELGRRIEHDVELGREPLIDLATARQVQALTIDQMTAALADLDVNGAAVLVRGPKTAIDDAFNTLMRTPAIVHFDQARQDMVDDDPTEHAEEAHEPHQSDVSYYEPALTDQNRVARWTFDVMPSIGFAQYTDDADQTLASVCCTGILVSGDVGYRLEGSKTFGLHLGTGYLQGYRHYRPPVLDVREFSSIVTPVDVGPFVRVEGGERLWGDVWMGLHIDHLYDRSQDPGTIPDNVRWTESLGFGLQAGIDIVRHGLHRFGIAAQLTGALISQSGYGVLAIGLAYRQ